jgi:hypothetical protein
MSPLFVDKMMSLFVDTPKVTPTSIETMMGHFVDLVDPDPKTIFLNDIAWALSRMPRYVGHTVSAVPWTIGQHSLFVVELVDLLRKPECPPDLLKSFYDFVNEKMQLNASLTDRVKGFAKAAPNALLFELLMHDSSEAFIVDVPTPLKQAEGFKQAYLALEQRMMAAIRERFAMGEIDPEYEIVVKWADAAALTIEAHHLIFSKGKYWPRLLPNLDMTSMRLLPAPKQSIDVYHDFIDMFIELRGEQLVR